MSLTYNLGERGIYMPEITLTEEQLQEKIDNAVKKATEELTATLEKKHNDEMGKQRIKFADEKKKAVEDAVANANLTTEEKVKKELEEQRIAEQQELAELRLEKKINDRAKKLADAQLPDFFKNDSRLLNAEDDKVDDVIKTIKEEYLKVLPKGAVVSTNVDVATATQNEKTKEEKELERVRKLGLGK